MPVTGSDLRSSFCFPPAPRFFFYLYNIYNKTKIMKKVIRLTEGDLVRLVKRIVKESDKENKGYDFLKDHTNINVDSIIDFDGDSYNDVDDFLNDVFPSAETFHKDFHKLYHVFRDYLHKLFDIMEDSFGFEGPGDCIDYIYEWNDRRM